MACDTSLRSSQKVCYYKRDVLFIVQYRWGLAPVLKALLGNKLPLLLQSFKIQEDDVFDDILTIYLSNYKLALQNVACCYWV